MTDSARAVRIRKSHASKAMAVAAEILSWCSMAWRRLSMSSWVCKAARVCVGDVGRYCCQDVHSSRQRPTAYRTNKSNESAKSRLRRSPASLPAATPPQFRAPLALEARWRYHARHRQCCVWPRGSRSHCPSSTRTRKRRGLRRPHLLGYPSKVSPVQRSAVQGGEIQSVSLFILRIHCIKLHSYIKSYIACLLT